MKPRSVEGWTRAEKDAARAILLEPSPIAVDGGELIGRDPRKISVEDFNRAGIEGAAAMEIIRAKCLDCCGEQPDEVRKCVAVACPNWASIRSIVRTYPTRSGPGGRKGCAARADQ